MQHFIRGHPFCLKVVLCNCLTTYAHLLQQIVFPYLGMFLFLRSVLPVHVMISILTSRPIVVTRFKEASVQHTLSCIRKTYTVAISVFEKWRLAVCKLPTSSAKASEVVSEQAGPSSLSRNVLCEGHRAHSSRERLLGPACSVAHLDT